MPGERQRPVGVPEVLLQRVQRVLEPLGYESAPEYVRTALREKLEVDEERVALLAEAEVAPVVPVPDASKKADRERR